MEPVITFRVENQKISRTDKFTVVANSHDYLRARFVFTTDEWQGIKTAIFRRGTTKTPIILDNNECYVPWEFLAGKGIGYVSVFCGALVTANEAPMEINTSGYGEGYEMQVPTPGVYEQVIQKLDSKADGVVIAGNVIRLLSGDKPIYEIEFDITGGTFEEWKEAQ
nr:MAG TPA: hypothetical protein [Caudoviricetes sp.]